MIIRGNTVGTNMSPDKIAEQIGTGGGGGGGSVAPLIVTLEGDGYNMDGAASHTSMDIFNYRGLVQIFAFGAYANLDHSSREEAVFTAGIGIAQLAITIGEDGRYTVRETTFVTTDDLGELNTALDGIIALQNHYMTMTTGGDE